MCIRDRYRLYLFTTTTKFIYLKYVQIIQIYSILKKVFKDINIYTRTSFILKNALFDYGIRKKFWSIDKVSVKLQERYLIDPDVMQGAVRHKYNYRLLKLQLLLGAMLGRGLQWLSTNV